MNELGIDHIDLSILQILMEDAWATSKDIGKQLKIKERTAVNRIIKMRKNGVIKGSSILVDESLLGNVITMYTLVVLNDHSGDTIAAFQAQAMKLPEVLECHHITGNFDFILKIAVKNMANYNNFAVKTLSNIPHVGSLQTNLIIHESKRLLSYPIELQYPELRKE